MLFAHAFICHWIPGPDECVIRSTSWAGRQQSENGVICRVAIYTDEHSHVSLCDFRRVHETVVLLVVVVVAVAVARVF